MSKICELCQAPEAWDTRFGIQLCQNCLEGFESVMKNDIDAIQKYADEENYPNATENAKQQIISLAKRKLNSGVENLKPRHVEKQEKEENRVQPKVEVKPLEQSTQSAQNTGGTTQNTWTSQGTASEKQNTKAKQDTDFAKQMFTTAQTVQGKSVSPYRLNYKKVLSDEEKREWIDKYIGIKRFVAGVWAFVGLGLGFVLARILGYGMDLPMVLFVLIGGGIGGALGTNAVGTAMMEAITAEQNIVTEELLTEILNNMKNE